MHLDMKSSIHLHSSESTATEDLTAAVASKQEMAAEPWQCLDAEDGTFTNADVSDVYKRRGISDSVAVSQHGMPWYPFESFDAFGALNVAFGVKSEHTENELRQTVETAEQKSEPVDCRMDFQTGDSGKHWQLEQFSSTADECVEFDGRPLRAVASVVPTPLTSSDLPVNSRRVCSDADSPMSRVPPPLVSVPSSPSAASHSRTPSMPFSGHLLSTDRLTGHGILPGSLREESRSPIGCEYVSESDPEADDGRCSPPAERTNHEAHRSKNAV